MTKVVNDSPWVVALVVVVVGLPISIILYMLCSSSPKKVSARHAIAWQPHLTFLLFLVGSSKSQKDWWIYSWRCSSWRRWASTSSSSSSASEKQAGLKRARDGAGRCSWRWGPRRSSSSTGGARSQGAASLEKAQAPQGVKIEKNLLCS